MGTNSQLIYNQRYHIHTFLKEGFCQSERRKEIVVHTSTISRELKRNREGRGYCPKQTQRFAMERQKKSKFRIKPEDWKLVEALIDKERSPEQISNFFRDNQIMHISHEWIYQYIYKDKRDGGSTSDAGKSAENAMAAMKNAGKYLTESGLMPVRS